MHFPTKDWFHNISKHGWIGGWYNAYISGFIYLLLTFLTAKSDPGKKLNTGCNMIKSGIERLKLREFPRYIFDTGKNTKIRTYYVGHSVPVPDFSKPIRIRSVPAPNILKLIITRNRTHTKFSKNFRTCHVYATKNYFFPHPFRRA